LKIKSIRAGVHRLSVTVPLLKEPIVRNAVFCEVETDDGYAGAVSPAAPICRSRS
jgi:hypothetical protein